MCGPGGVLGPDDLRGRPDGGPAGAGGGDLAVPGARSSAGGLDLSRGCAQSSTPAVTLSGIPWWLLTKMLVLTYLKMIPLTSKKPVNEPPPPLSPLTPPTKHNRCFTSASRRASRVTTLVPSPWAGTRCSPLAPSILRTCRGVVVGSGRRPNPPCPSRGTPPRAPTPLLRR
jgi:hypothetical protein